jgi:hypothetical protein
MHSCTFIVTNFADPLPRRKSDPSQEKSDLQGRLSFQSAVPAPFRIEGAGRLLNLSSASFSNM